MGGGCCRELLKVARERPKRGDMEGFASCGGPPGMAEMGERVGAVVNSFRLPKSGINSGEGWVVVGFREISVGGVDVQYISACLNDSRLLRAN